MIKINLLPPEYQAARARQEQQILVGAVAAVIISVALSFWYVQSRRSAALEISIREADAELARYKAINEQIARIEADKLQLIAKRDVIKNLNRSRLIYPVLFEDLLPIIPSDVWVTNMSMSEQGGVMKITLNSNALSNFAVATWLTNLQQASHFSNVELGAINYTYQGDQGASQLGFTLTCNYQHQGPFPLAD